MIKKTKKTLSLLAVLVMIFTMIPFTAFAEGSGGGKPDLEWYNFRNNQENNGITERPTPISADETWMRFASKFGTGWGAAPTPPLILDGYLYIGVNNQIVKLDKKTGKEVGRSDAMFGRVGFAMHPILYADGSFFVQVGNGVIQAVDYKTLKCKWHTPKMKGQTISTIAHAVIDGKGYIYTGTWNRENADGNYFCVATDDEGLEPELDKDGNETGRYIKEHVWDFTPKRDDKALAEDADAKPRGFYWAGAYACENYIAFGSDDGTSEGDYTANAVFYTLDPKTGEIIDRIDKIKGDIRSNAVYDNGYLYFNTKGGILYRAAVDEDGHFDHERIQNVDLGGMTTATPIVYKNKIYLGVAGKGGQFDPDGGHSFAVISNKDKLKEIYRLPIKGYPQAGALLSTAHEKDDYDGDGDPDGRIYLYFTYNAEPGGIYFTYDTPDGKETPGDAGEIFVPDKQYQQYCISPIIVDRQGTLYYKNDSCNIFAVEINPAYLTGIKLKTKGTDGSAMMAKLIPASNAQIANYEAVARLDSKAAYLSLTLPRGVSADVNGKPYTENMEIPLGEDKTPVEIVTRKDGFSRSYNVSIRRERDNAYLGELYVSSSNSPTGGTIVPVDPELSTGCFDYVADMTDAKLKLFYNVWIKPADPTTVITGVEGLSNVKDVQLNDVPADKTKKRCAVYFIDQGKTAEVAITVRAEAGKENKYRLKLFRKVKVAGIEITGGDRTLEKGSKAMLTAKIFPDDASVRDVVWSVSDPEIAQINAETGELTALEAGGAVVTAAAKDDDKITATCKVTVVKKENPAGPANPGGPALPSENQENPAEPANPGRPALPSENQAEDKRPSNKPRTDDESNPWSWAALAAVLTGCAAGICNSISKEKR